jgi:hypothetical protein
MKMIAAELPDSSNKVQSGETSCKAFDKVPAAMQLLAENPTCISKEI